MSRSFAGAAFAVFLALGSVARAEEPCAGFTRQIGTGGVVIGSFADTAAAAGAPEAIIEQAASALDLGRDLREGDHVYLRWEQAFTLEGERVGAARLLWLELKTKAKGTLVVQRFKPRDGEEQLYLASGLGTAPPRIRAPLDVMTTTSGYGLRADPLDQPVILVAPPPKVATEPEPADKDQPAPLLPADAKEVNHAYAGFHIDGRPAPTPGFDDQRNNQLDGVMARRRAQARADAARKAEQEAEAERAAAAPPKPAPAPPPKPPQLFMHTGLDLLANVGTPIHAAADGVIFGARLNGLYGNWVRIEHAGKLSTVYGHLSRFAPDLAPGVAVKRGDVIGYVGSTGRSTGAHLHFELLVDERPVNPAGHPATKPRQLAGPDLDRLRKQIASSLRERDLEDEVDAAVALSQGAPLHPL